jgi:transcriptional regulator with XRE-family HTH domain
MSTMKITLAAARVNAGLSQREAAKLLGITHGTLRNYEHGKQVPSWTTVKEMERIYGISADNMIIEKHA